MKEPVDHIERPRLPWRSDDDPALTECGYAAVKVQTITRSDFALRLKEYGEQRTAILTCMTCAGTARRWGTWEEDPRTALSREIAWEGHGRWMADERGTRLRGELQAIALLIARHHEEFKKLVNDVTDVVDLLAVKRKRG